MYNFANKYAGGGFPSLKLQIASCISSNEVKFFKENEQTKNVKDVLISNKQNVEVALNNTVAVNSEQTLSLLADKILSAKKVEIYGVYRSGVVATDFYYQLLQIGIPANYVSDVLTCAVSASFLEKDSLVIAISWSGRTKDVIDAVKLAKNNKVPVVCITGNKNSPLAKLSDHVLVAASSGNPNSYSATEARYSQLLITDALCGYIMSKFNEKGKANYAEMDKILNSHNVED